MRLGADRDVAAATGAALDARRDLPIDQMEERARRRDRDVPAIGHGRLCRDRATVDVERIAELNVDVAGDRIRWARALGRDDPAATEVHLWGREVEASASSASPCVRDQPGAPADRYLTAGGVDGHVATVARAGRATVDSGVAGQREVVDIQVDVTGGTAGQAGSGGNGDLSTVPQRQCWRGHLNPPTGTASGSCTEETAIRVGNEWRAQPIAHELSRDRDRISHGHCDIAAGAGSDKL